MAINVPATREAMAVYYGTRGTFISLHTGNPGTTGANEATGGSYARKATVWAAGTEDGVINGSQVTIDVAPGTYTHYGVFSLVTGGVFVDWQALATPIVMSIAGQIKVTPTFTQS